MLPPFHRDHLCSKWTDFFYLQSLNVFSIFDCLFGARRNIVPLSDHVTAISFRQSERRNGHKWARMVRHLNIEQFSSFLGEIFHPGTYMLQKGGSEVMD